MVREKREVLEKVQEMRKKLRSKAGTLPSSAVLIREDRDVDR